MGDPRCFTVKEHFVQCEIHKRYHSKRGECVQCVEAARRRRNSHDYNTAYLSGSKEGQQQCHPDKIEEPQADEVGADKGRKPHHQKQIKGMKEMRRDHKRGKEMQVQR